MHKKGNETVSVQLDATGKFGVTLVGSLESGIRVKTVTRNSPAFKGGMRPDDIVLAVNDVPCFTQKTTLQLMSYVDRTIPVTIQIDRIRECGCLGF